MTWLGVVDTAVIVAILWALCRIVDRIEALEQRVERLEMQDAAKRLGWLERVAHLPDVPLP